MARPEEKIEKEFVKRCKLLGVKACKFEVIGEKGNPDRIVFIPRGILLLIEFKTPKGHLSEHQHDKIVEFNKLGFEVYVFDSWEEAIDLVKTKLNV